MRSGLFTCRNVELGNWRTVGSIRKPVEYQGSTPEIFSIKAIISPKNPIGMDQIVSPGFNLGGLKNNFFLNLP
jgi:hypothetical protein